MTAQLREVWVGVREGSPVLVTGAAGRVGSALRAPLRRDYRLRLTDLRDLPDPVVSGGPLAPHGESFRRGDLTDPAFAVTATEGVAAIVHLAGDPGPTASWDSLLHANIAATATLFDAARRHRVRKVVYASSVHAAGGYNDPATWPVDPTWPPRPCCPYGVSKVAGEAIARLYADQVDGASVVALRLALVTYPPRWRHETRGWLADGDLVGLVRAALDSDVSYGVYFGASMSDRPRYRLDVAEREIGYRPRESASPDGLTDLRPAYTENCRLWQITAGALDEPTRRPHEPDDQPAHDKE